MKADYSRAYTVGDPNHIQYTVGDRVLSGHLNPVTVPTRVPKAAASSSTQQRVTNELKSHLGPLSLLTLSNVRGRAPTRILITASSKGRH